MKIRYLPVVLLLFALLLASCGTAVEPGKPTGDGTDVSDPDSRTENLTGTDDGLPTSATPETDSGSDHGGDGTDEPARYLRVDQAGEKDPAGGYLLFGEYPQTAMAEGVTLTDGTDERGYRIGSDGASYAQQGDDWFRMEPILWRILSEEDGRVLLLSERILDAHDYGENNGYASSDLRAWLNGGFADTAFGEEDRSLIAVAEVNNSARSTNPASNAAQWNRGSNPYAGDATADAVFLLSVEEVTDPAYGFSDGYADDDPARAMPVSDYARARGVPVTTGSEYDGNGWWWLRSPVFNEADGVRAVYRSGHAALTVQSTASSGGVVPALYLNTVSAAE